MPRDKNGDKWACEPCVRGHRSTRCVHFERVMIRVRKPGRPLAHCPHPNSEECTCKIDRVVMIQIPRRPLSVDKGAAAQQDGCTCRAVKYIKRDGRVFDNSPDYNDDDVSPTLPSNDQIHMEGVQQEFNFNAPMRPPTDGQSMPFLVDHMASQPPTGHQEPLVPAFTGDRRLSQQHEYPIQPLQHQPVGQQEAIALSEPVALFDQETSSYGISIEDLKDPRAKEHLSNGQPFMVAAGLPAPSSVHLQSHDADAKTCCAPADTTIKSTTRTIPVLKSEDPMSQLSMPSNTSSSIAAWNGSSNEYVTGTSTPATSLSQSVPKTGSWSLGVHDVAQHLAGLSKQEFYKQHAALETQKVRAGQALMPNSTCTCGPGCSCFGCLAHPFNVGTQTNLQALSTIMEQDVPTAQRIFATSGQGLDTEVAPELGQCELAAPPQSSQSVKQEGRFAMANTAEATFIYYYPEDAEPAVEPGTFGPLMQGDGHFACVPPATMSQSIEEHSTVKSPKTDMETQNTNFTDDNAIFEHFVYEDPTDTTTVAEFADDNQVLAQYRSQHEDGFVSQGP